MQFSSDLPSGLHAVQQYVSLQAGQLPTNVSKEADAAFMRELERTDPARYKALVRNMRFSAARSQRQASEVQQTITERFEGRRERNAERQRRLRQRKNVSQPLCNQ